jgi:putative N6-adenine-specific DNA methylase
MPPTLALFAACAPGLEPLLAREVAALGAEPREVPGGVELAADARLAMRAALWLGTASHLLVRLGKFRCRAPGELERKARELPWRDWLRPDVPLQVRAISRASRVFHTGLIADRVRSAIGAAFGEPPLAAASMAEPAPPAARIHVRFLRDVCTLSLEATPEPLHRRGYRIESGKAPLREDLAHALVLASGWSPELALLDPFCGSGTIAIEAAALALGLPPGRLRPAPLGHLAPFDARAWGELSGAPCARRAEPQIAASDRDAGAISAARANAARAGVEHAIAFTRCAVTRHPWLEQPAAAPARGVIVTNPPFGQRVPESARLETLYQAFGHRAARLGAGWRIAILAHDPRLARRTGVALRAAFTTRHGGLPVTALTGALG